MYAKSTTQTKRVTALNALLAQSTRTKTLKDANEFHIPRPAFDFFACNFFIVSRGRLLM